MEAVTTLLSTGSAKFPKTVSYLPEAQSFLFYFKLTLPPKWGPFDLDIMNKRQEQLQSHLHTSSEINSIHPDETIAQPAYYVPISGWCILVENRGWKSCPVGNYYEN